MKRFKRILVIPDLHCPFHHVDAFKFLDAVNEKYKPDKVVCLGDEIDGHTISFHDTDPDIPFSPSSELDKAIWHLRDLFLLFPRGDLIESNHGSLVYRRGKFAGLPKSVFKSWLEIIEAPKGWSLHYELTLEMSNKDKVYIHHGLSSNTLANSKNKAQNYIQGHFHSKFECLWWANSERWFWAVSSGCLIDAEALAFSYGKNHLPKPILGCTMLIDGVPKLIPMLLDGKKRWTGKLI